MGVINPKTEPVLAPVVGLGVTSRLAREGLAREVRLLAGEGGVLFCSSEKTVSGKLGATSTAGVGAGATGGLSTFCGVCNT